MHACDFTHSRKLHRRIFRIMLHYSTVCAAPAQNTSQLRQIGQLSRELRFACTDLYENGDGYIPFVLEVNIDEHQSFHGLA